MIFIECLGLFFFFVPKISHFAENTLRASIHSSLQTRPHLGWQIFSGPTHHFSYPEASGTDFLLSPGGNVAATPRPEGPSSAAPQAGPLRQVHHGHADLRPECDEGPPAAQV